MIDLLSFALLLSTAAPAAPTVAVVPAEATEAAEPAAKGKPKHDDQKKKNKKKHGKKKKGKKNKGDKHKKHKGKKHKGKKGKKGKNGSDGGVSTSGMRIAVFDPSALRVRVGPKLGKGPKAKEAQRRKVQAPPKQKKSF